MTLNSKLVCAVWTFRNLFSAQKQQNKVGYLTYKMYGTLQAFKEHQAFIWIYK